LLSPGGVFVVTVPDAASLQASVWGAHWLHWDVPRHRHHFNEASLCRLLKNAGLEVAAVRRGAIEYDWFGVIQSALNKVCSRPNVLFDRLSRSGAKASPWDVAVSYTLGPAVGAASLPMALVGRGATLTVMAKGES
jgi:hypothetical protein